MIINYVAVCKQRFTKNDTQLYWFKTREDKGDREGIPHTHSIPWVIRLELFLESIWSYLARCVDVSWRFRMTKRRAKNVGWKADESIKKSRAFLIIEAKWVGAHLGKGNQFNSKLSKKFRRSIETGRLYNKASRSPYVISWIIKD